MRSHAAAPLCTLLVHQLLCGTGHVGLMPITEGPFILDCRPAHAYARGHLVSSVNLCPLQGGQESDAALLLRLQQTWLKVYNEVGLEDPCRFLLVGDDDDDATTSHLARVAHALRSAPSLAPPAPEPGAAGDDEEVPYVPHRRCRGVWVLDGGFGCVDAPQWAFLVRAGTGAQASDAIGSLPAAFPMPLTQQLFVSGVGPAGDPEALRAVGITHVVCCTPEGGLPQHKAVYGVHGTGHNSDEAGGGAVSTGTSDAVVVGKVPHLRYLWVPFDDAVSEHRLPEVLRAAVPWVLRAMRSDPEHRVLVHCQRGRSRSVSVCVGALMAQHAFDYDTALHRVQQRRAIAEPNTRFQADLRAMTVELHQMTAM